MELVGTDSLAGKFELQDRISFAFIAAAFLSLV